MTELISMKALCFLHTRDPIYTSRRPIVDVLNGKSKQITWTDLQAFLMEGTVGEDILKILQKQGRLKKEKYEYTIAAMNYLQQRRNDGPHGAYIHAFQSIYDVIWRYDFLDYHKRAFRGQFDPRH